MRRWLLAVALGASVVLAAPAYAADEKTLSCVAEHLDAPAIAMIEANFEQMILAPMDAPLPKPGDDQANALAAAAGPCAKLHGWSRPATEAAITYTLVTLGRRGAARGMKKLGIDPAPLETFYLGLPISTREVAMPGGEWPATIQALVVDAQKRKLFDMTQGKRVGRYLGCLNLIDFSRAEFLRA